MVYLCWTLDLLYVEKIYFINFLPFFPLFSLDAIWLAITKWHLNNSCSLWWYCWLSLHPQYTSWYFHNIAKWLRDDRSCILPRFSIVTLDFSRYFFLFFRISCCKSIFYQILPIIWVSLVFSNVRESQVNISMTVYENLQIIHHLSNKLSKKVSFRVQLLQQCRVIKTNDTQITH